MQLPSRAVPTNSNWIFEAVKMIISHLLLVIGHRLEPQPIRRTTTSEIERRRDNFQNFDRQVQRDRIDFSMRTVSPGTTPTNGRL